VGRTSNAQERRSQIIQALYNCLSEKGHETITIKQIAEQAKLPHGVIHYYFKGKDEIITGLIHSLQAGYQQLWTDTLQGCKKEELIHAGITFLAEKMVLDPKINRVLYNLVQMGFEKKIIRKALRQSYQMYRTQLSELFFSNMPAEQVKRRSALLLATVEGLALQWMIEPGFIEREQVKTILFGAIQI